MTQPPPASPLRVLLVQADAAGARAVGDALTRAGGIEVEHCATGEEALRRLREPGVDALVTDQALPGMSGLDLRAAIGRNDVATVMLTAQGSEQLAVAALKAGFNDYVVEDAGLSYLELLPHVLREAVGRRRDRTARESAERALRESEQRYALAVAGAADGIWDWNLRSGVLYYSPRWKEMVGRDPASHACNPEEWTERIHAEDAPAFQRDLEAHLEGATPHFENEHRVRHDDGSWRWMLARGLCIREGGKAVRIAGSLTDVTARRLAEERLLHDAFHDPLTGLANRTRFLERLRASIKHARREEDFRFAVLFLDLDSFKIVNDSLGHLVGDQLLVVFARRLAETIPDDVLLARIGGDEFALLAEDLAGVRDAERLAARIAEALQPAFMLEGRETFVTVSIGIAMGDAHYKHPEEILRDADTAMYAAKGRAARGTAVFEPSMHAVAVSRLHVERELRQALKANRLVLHYQPIVSLVTRRVRGFEALLRWDHPERGCLLPLEFMPVAEESGFIVPIGKFVIEEACRALGRWQARFRRAPPISVSVNLSSRQFHAAELVSDIAEAMRVGHVAPHTLRLEITETAIIDSEESVAARLWHLRSLQARVDLDDFGTGYSSLSYLRRFPIDAVKIDKSFVHGMLTDRHDAEIVRTVVTLASSLGLETVAEGVETDEQLQWLREAGCPNVQGNFISPALPADEVVALLERDPEW